MSRVSLACDQRLGGGVRGRATAGRSARHNWLAPVGRRLSARRVRCLVIASRLCGSRGCRVGLRWSTHARREGSACRVPRPSSRTGIRTRPRQRGYCFDGQASGPRPNAQAAPRTVQERCHGGAGRGSDGLDHGRGCAGVAAVLTGHAISFSRRRGEVAPPRPGSRCAPCARRRCTRRARVACCPYEDHRGFSEQHLGPRNSGSINHCHLRGRLRLTSRSRACGTRPCTRHPETASAPPSRARDRSSGR